MLRNYITVSIRNFLKQKGYTFISVTGLSFGLALCLLTFIFVQDEVSYDNYHNNAENKYRLVLDFKTAESNIPMATTSIPVGKLMVSEFPEVIDALRINGARNPLISSSPEKFFYETGFFFSESKIFDYFTMRFILGDPNTALNEPNSVVLTEEMAEKYFGSENPIGKSIKFNQTEEYRITAVIENAPDNSHFKYGFLASYDFEGQELAHIRKWATGNIYTYLTLQDGADSEELEAKFPEFVDTYAGELLKAFNGNIDYTLQPFREIYLLEELGNEIGVQSNILYSYILTSIALFILIIACVNFMNLATARSAGRAREVGMRKVLGAERAQIVRQFLSESVILSFFSFLFAIVLVLIILPEFNELIEKELSLFDIMKYKLSFLIPLSVILVGLISGSYPALFLSSFQPVKVLKGTVQKVTSGISLRKVLVVFQFSLSIILIAGAVVVYQQQQFLLNKELGFNSNQLLTIYAAGEGRDISVFKESLREYPGINMVTRSNSTPGSNSANGTILMPEGAAPEEQTVIMRNEIDFDFIDTYQLQIIEGRNFSEEFETDATTAIVINEATAERFGWEEPIGKVLTAPGSETDMNERSRLIVIGVVKDFHHFTAQQEISPIILKINPEETQIITARVQSGNMSEVLKEVELKWNAFAPGFPFEYSFVDEDFAQAYREYEVMGLLTGYLSFLAICIACLGLFGLASFMTEQRRKEVGIRKVMGASVSGIVVLMTKDFIKWVILANIIALPAAFFIMEKWLQDFVYRIELEPSLFVLSGSIALFIALLTISYQVVKTAFMSPIESMRHE